MNQAEFFKFHPEKFLFQILLQCETSDIHLKPYIMTYKGNSRRNFLKTLTTTALVSGSSISGLSRIIDEKNEAGIPLTSGPVNAISDGPASPLFEPLVIKGNLTFSGIDSTSVSVKMAESLKYAPSGKSVAWGIPFNIPDKIIFLKDKAYKMDFTPSSGNWIIFMHAADRYDLKKNASGFYEKPFRGIGLLNQEIARYVIIFEDGQELSLSVRNRYHIGMFQQIWGENCIESVAYQKPGPIDLRQPMANNEWGRAQTLAGWNDRGNWINWLWAWENPHPEKKVRGIRFEPLNQTPVLISAITLGNVKSNPLRWDTRKKALITLPENIVSGTTSLLSVIGIDLGQVISVTPRQVYPDKDWSGTYNNKVPEKSANEVIVEYAAHPDARLYLEGQEPLPLSGITVHNSNIIEIKPANRKVKIRVIEKESGKTVPVKFHAHGEYGELLVPVDRNRQPNNNWFEDYSVDYVNMGRHNCTYIPGETTINLPSGKVYVEISKGFEITPIRKVIEISPETEVITLEIEKTLQWREKGWVSADTHVHFLSPGSALLEGSGEGVNVVNLLASQWGELMTNVGDFDGKTTYGLKTAGGDGEYLVRVGTENRQHVMGHISLLGYEGNIIAPMTVGGPDESAIGDPVEILLTEWAQQCKKQNGVVILPHFPNPRLENASAIITGGVDGVEMTSGSWLYGGIDPYSLMDWYRYLNCGYFVAAVGGTDKMDAATAVGAVRTYANIGKDREFSYEEWKEAVRRGNTFVTYGPLIEFNVEGKPAGSRIEMPSSGGTVNISWEVESVTIPMSRIELIVNGEVKESVSLSQWQGKGTWSFKISKSSWIAVLVRGHYPGRPEIIAAHTSPVMVSVKNSPMIVAEDALTILDQIEGAMAYLDTIGTRAEDKIYKRMKMVLTSSHRIIHNRMHEMGYFHQHTSVNDHKEHH